MENVLIEQIKKEINILESWVASKWTVHIDYHIKKRISELKTFVDDYNKNQQRDDEIIYMIEVIRNILNQKAVKAVCTQCGDYQVYTAIYCSSCGKKFDTYPKTLREALLIVKNRTLDIPHYWYKPSYIFAINKYSYKLKDEDKDEFIKLLEQELNENNCRT